ncbi:MAG TPA: phosphatase PAP2 family protein [Polyangiaceae bacterium]
MKQSDHPKWDGPILFDEPLRNAIRLRSPDALTTTRTISNVTAFVPVVQEVVFDSLFLPLVDRNLDVAWQMSMMNAQSYGLTSLVIISLYNTVGRTRPSYRECQAGKSDDPLCDTGQYADFPSGHTATAMTAAGLMCAHHAHLPLYGGGALDDAACIEGVTLGLGTAVLRLMGDRHYFSDVFVGGAFGFLSGWGLPTLLHYTKWTKPLGALVDRPDVKMGVTLGTDGAPLGAGLRGTF